MITVLSTWVLKEAGKDVYPYFDIFFCYKYNNSDYTDRGSDSLFKTSVGWGPKVYM